MSSLISNIRKASAPLTESSAHLGRLLLQLGQAADSALDAETLAELDKQATLAACQAIEAENARAAAAAAAAGDGDGDGGGGGGDAGTKEASGSGGGDNSTGGDGTSATEESGGLHEESSTATTVELSVDSSQHAGGEIGSNNSSSHHHQPPPVGSQAGGGSDPVAIATAASTITTPRSLMQASSVHSNTSSHAAPSPSSSLHGPNKNTGGGAAASEPSTLPSADHGGEAAAGTPKESPSSQPEAAPSERKSSADGPVTVVLHGFDTEADEKLVVCESRALAHLFTRIRNRDTPPPTFRFYASRLLRILAEEGIACLESSRQFITTPTAATFSSVFVDESNVCVVSILRAGDALAEAAQACLPSAPAGKILIQRDEESRDKHPVLFYKKLPPKIATMQVLLCDPMLATGGSALMAIRCLVESGVKESAVVFVTVVVCPEGLGAVRAEFPEVTIVTGAIDDCLDERRYILPGLGDFGDRFFGTVA